jgi:PAS domain-containing protein
VLGVATDITARRQAEEAYRTLVDYSRQGLIILQDGRIVFANVRSAEITGYPAEELVTFTSEALAALVPPEQLDILRQEIARVGWPLRASETESPRRGAALAGAEHGGNGFGKTAVQSPCRQPLSAIIRRAGLSWWNRADPYCRVYRGLVAVPPRSR